ncbi:MAG: hypothetical protein KJ795_15005 [Gammaproteobacteria bacterium]|nr:hypothetical protein [Gammaproteobacteria bacterium]MBU1968485.1 hypothetical protein [Gammaproteobacteria bacterium]
MSFSKADMADLKWSLGAFVLSIALSAALIMLSSEYIVQTRKELQTAQKQLVDARENLAAAQSDKENMATYALEYNTLLARRIIGNEQRLDWLEGLEKLRQQGLVLDFKYTIAPQQGYAPAPPVTAGNFVLNRSPMTLQIEMKHEEQLLHLLEAIRTKMSGWFMLDGCTISRTGSGIGPGVLKTDCSGGWFTMKNRNAP